MLASDIWRFSRLESITVCASLCAGFAANCAECQRESESASESNSDRCAARPVDGARWGSNWPARRAGLQAGERGATQCRLGRTCLRVRSGWLARAMLARNLRALAHCKPGQTDRPTGSQPAGQPAGQPAALRICPSGSAHTAAAAAASRSLVVNSQRPAASQAGRKAAASQRDVVRPAVCESAFAAFASRAPSAAAGRA